MKYFYSLGLGLAALAASSQAFAEDASSDKSKWSVTITPRYQHLLFYLYDSEENLGSISTIGGSVTVRSPDQRIGITGTFMSGKGNGSSTFTGRPTGIGAQNIYDYRVKRQELQFQLEYTPRETAATFIGGYHRFRANYAEQLNNPIPGNSEKTSQIYSINALELGIRLASRLGANSRHSISAQLMLGVGRGKYKYNFDEVFVPIGNTNITNITNQKGTGALADFALGYNVFLSNHITLGARGRAYVFYVDADKSDPVFAVVPELNMSFRF